MAFIDTRALAAKQPLPGWQGRFFSSQHMTFGYYEVAAGAAIHAHSHSNEEVWHVLEGELEVTIAGETRIARQGAVAIVPPDTLHSVRALSNGRAIVVDSPARRSIGGVSTD
ncbi:MAG TPA: cupin domain-containing protein [Myxococcota bacterium]|nr:cupin domain-containing protein [Myxococcota bacterium]